MFKNPFKKSNESSLVKELLIIETYSNGVVLGIYYVDSKENATEKEISKCRNPEKISAGSLIFDSNFNKGVFDFSHTPVWKES